MITTGCVHCTQVPKLCSTHVVLCVCGVASAQCPPPLPFSQQQLQQLVTHGQDLVGGGGGGEGAQL